MSLINKEAHEMNMELSSKTTGIYGRAGIGKSKLASMFDGVYFAATEAGLSHIDGVFKTNIVTYKMFLDFCSEFCGGGHGFKTLCIDTFDNLAKLCTEWKCEELGIDEIGDYKKFGAYHLVTEELSRVVRKLSQCKFGLILISHYTSEEMESQTKKWNRATISVSGKNRAVMLDICDPLLFMDSKMKGDEEIGVIRTKPSIYWEAKDKAQVLPEFIEYPLAKTELAYEKIKESYS